MTLTTQEAATILAALRCWQDEIYLDTDGVVCAHSFQLAGTGHFEDDAPLTPDEIDTLCERINSGHDRPNELSAVALLVDLRKQLPAMDGDKPQPGTDAVDALCELWPHIKAITEKEMKG